MEFITKGQKSAPAMLLIHPSKCDAHCFEVLYPYLEGYYLICPTLDGHNLQDTSDYPNRHVEADRIIAYLQDENIGRLHALLGLSLGAAAAYEIYRRDALEIGQVFLDGAPFHKLSPLLRFLMVRSQISMRNKCRKNPDLVSEVDEMYPGLGPLMNRITAHYTDRTIQNIVKETGIPLDMSIDSSKLTFLYGEKDFYRKSVADLRKAAYQSRILIEPECGHVQWILHQPEQYAQLLKESDGAFDGQAS